MTQFEVSLIVPGHGSEDDLKAAMSYLIKKAMRYSPDYRFDWSNVDLTVSEYTENPIRR